MFYFWNHLFFVKRVLSGGWVPGQAGFTFCPTGGGAICKACGVGSIPGTMLESCGRLAQKKKNFLSIFSLLMMKVLKVLGHPRRRGVPANPPPSPLQTTPCPSEYNNAPPPFF